MARSPKSFRTRVWRWIGTAIVLAVVFTNGAVLANDLLRAMAVRFRFEMPFLLGGLFNVGGVFGTYGSENSELVLLGLPSDAIDRTQESNWIVLDKDAYFPTGSFAEQLNHIVVSVNPLPAYTWRRADAPEVVTRKIRDRYNRQHPDRPIKKVRIREFRWPRSKDGYWALKRPETTTVRDLYTGPRSSQ